MKLSKRVLEMEESVTLASDARAKALRAQGKDVRAEIGRASCRERV